MMGSVPAFTHAPSQPDDEAIVRAVADEFIRDGRLEAVSIGVTIDGEPITVHRGPLYRDAAAPADDDTIFEIRSITKTFVGTLAAQAVLDGKLSWNEDIRTYLGPGFENLEKDGHPILIRHLLTHTSGLPSNNPIAEEDANTDSQADAAGLDWRTFERTELGMTREAFFANLAGFELASIPGEQFLYSNLGTNLTALILERVYQKSLDELVDQFILTPAGMEDTALNMRDPRVTGRVASGYNAIGERVPPWLVWPLGGAEGGAKATVPDTVRYMAFQLDNRNPAAQLSQVPLYEIAWDYRIASSWWAIERPQGSLTFRHDGGYANVRNVMILFPQDDLGIYAVTNRVTPEANGVLSELVYRVRAELVAAREGAEQD
ncbi:serine hydrolase domain-containing protein [Paraurantiacibacter namhicola]|nr:serine hydrolase domain-containing protein [Paraurantiacibacter namhicola]